MRVLLPLIIVAGLFGLGLLGAANRGTGWVFGVAMATSAPRVCRTSCLWLK